MNTRFLTAALAAAACFTLVPGSGTAGRHAAAAELRAVFDARDSNDAAIDDAFERRISNLQVAGRGTVVKLLPDDARGSRHQRFIVRLDSGRTLLVSHNIDLAQRIDALRAGDPVAFHGEYEWNPKGGVIHWTHHDPQGRHRAGWIRHDGKTYR